MSEPVLATHALTKRYGHTSAVDGVDLTIQRGQIYGLVGRNGAGKTTIIRMVSGQTYPTEGKINLFGDHEGKDLNRARARTGAMVETPSFYPYLSGSENLEYYRRQRGIPGRACVAEVLAQVGLDGAGKKPFKQYSLGMKQRLGLGLALMNRADFLLLDEPINGLDPEGIVEFRNILLTLNHERETTILISSHILPELANVATHFGFLDRGHMLEQISAKALAEKCRACLQLAVDDTAKAALVLEQVLDTRAFEVLPGNIIRLYAFLDQPQRVTAALMERGVALYGAEQKNTNLEDYFLALIGGAVHA